MKKVMLGLVFSVVSLYATAKEWSALELGVVGVVAESSNAKLVLSTVLDEDTNDSGVAFYYYPAQQPLACDIAHDTQHDFSINGHSVVFRKFCIEERDGMVTAWTPNDYDGAKVVISGLTDARAKYLTIDRDTFSNEQFAAQVENLMAD